jgi:tungstate transport system substrate-binding protein
MFRWDCLARECAQVAATVLLCSQAVAQDKSIVVASTTSTQDSGLFRYLLPIVKQKTGIDVKVLAQGTGQALDTARRGDADVVFVHAKSAEEKFLAEGFGVKRYPAMYNDFVLIGPQRSRARTSSPRCTRSRIRPHPSSRAAIAPAPI